MRKARFVLTALCFYLLCYLFMRMAWAEVWEKDARIYVIYPESSLALYYVFRPIAVLDEHLTGMGSHIGPHLD